MDYWVGEEAPKSTRCELEYLYYISMLWTAMMEYCQTSKNTSFSPFQYSKQSSLINTKLLFQPLLRSIFFQITASTTQQFISLRNHPFPIQNQISQALSITNPHIQSPIHPSSLSNMSTAKKFGKIFGNIQKNINCTKKFINAISISMPGSRILPSRTTKADFEYEVRIDSGEKVCKMLYVYLQVNANPKSTYLKNWLKNNSTHANHAVTTLDTTAADMEDEVARVMADLHAKGVENLQKQ